MALCSNGEVYAWGANTYGQLGTGDTVARSTPILVRLSSTLKIIQITCGSNHSVLLTSNGQVHTFGNDLRGQPEIGHQTSKRATWVGALADNTYIKLDQSLINAHNLQASNVIANSECLSKNCFALEDFLFLFEHYFLVLLPMAAKSSSRREDCCWKSLVICRDEGHCRSFNGPNQADFKGQTVCMDPAYNVIWR